MKKIGFTPDEWTILDTVARAASANPFGDARDALDSAIAGDGGYLPTVLAKVGEKVGAMTRAGLANAALYDGERRETMRGVLLFYLFHRYMDRFDELIREQERAGDSPVRVAFARELLGELTSFGFSEAEALRFLSIFYQMRRAWYFIRHSLVGEAPPMRRLRERLWNCVFTHDLRAFERALWDRMENFSILLLGETGTGKGAAAAAIGRSGFIPFDPVKLRFAESFTANFISINLAEYPQTLIEAALFGHRKGAFTGAVEDRDGLFARCAPHGALFLDEIGEVAAEVQVKLLRVLQERAFTPVGGVEPKRFSGRVIAATNRPIAQVRGGGGFREDLYYRLSSDEIELPTLKERISADRRELTLLTRVLLARMVGDQGEGMLPRVMEALQKGGAESYAWPGNVRELEQAVRGVLLTGCFRMKSLGQPQDGDTADTLMSLGRRGVSAEVLLSRYCKTLYNDLGSYEEVARKVGLDRRTVKKYLELRDREENRD